jgi:hypothetical protein
LVVVVLVDWLGLEGDAPIELVLPEDDVSLLEEPEPVDALPLLPMPLPLGEVLEELDDVPGVVEPVVSRLLHALRETAAIRASAAQVVRDDFIGNSLWDLFGNGLGKGWHRRPNGTLGSSRARTVGSFRRSV